MSSFYKNSYQTIIPMLTRLSFPCLFVCHSRACLYVIPALDAGICLFFTIAPARCSCSVPVPLRLAACATPALHRRSSPLLACKADNAEAQDEVGAIGAVPILAAHLAVVGSVVPAAAAAIAVLAVADGIPAQFRNIAAHVV